MPSTPANTARLGVVSFLNARPLIAGVDPSPDVSLRYEVPSVLPGLLRQGAIDVGLLPVIDLIRSQGAWQRISNAIIGSDGETLTVRVFSRVPPQAMTTLHVDPDSHTSVALAGLLWQRYYRRPIQFVPLAEVIHVARCESVLLIGDKVVTERPVGFDYEVDLGEAWKAWTGLPFVFAAWAARAEDADQPAMTEIAARLEGARDRGVQQASTIAATEGPRRGWPVELALKYMTCHLTYVLSEAAQQGLNLFAELARAEGLVPSSGERV